MTQGGCAEFKNSNLNSSWATATCPSLPNDFDQHSLPPSPIELSVENLFPWPEVEFPLRDGNDHFAAHHLPFQMRVGVVFARAVVMILRRRFMRGEFLEPYFIVVEQAALVIVYEDRGGDMHGIHQAHPFLNAAFGDEGFDRLRDIHEPPPVRNLEPQILCQ